MPNNYIILYVATDFDCKFFDNAHTKEYIIVAGVASIWPPKSLPFIFYLSLSITPSFILYSCYSWSSAIDFCF
jgi:hypothetical protein